MSRITYVDKTFGPEALDVIAKANAVCAAYDAQGFDLTLRQLYYQFVSKAWIPNTMRDYKRLGNIINDARLAGRLDWDYIVDRTRSMAQNSHWSTPADIIRSAARSYAEDKWAQQETYVEVWIEKNALVGVLEQVCPQNDVPYFACVGYTSQSEVWSAAQRIGGKISDGKKAIIIHLGDHDPSGIDMSRDIEDRLRMFIAQDVFNAEPMPARDGESSLGYTKEETKEEWETLTYDHLTIDRIALNWDQVQAYNPPPNPAKITDSRAIKYIARFGRESWELDALDPATLTALIQNSIDFYKDEDIWEDAVDAETRQREVLTKASARWADVAAFLEAS